MRRIHVATACAGSVRICAALMAVESRNLSSKMVTKKAKDMVPHSIAHIGQIHGMSLPWPRGADVFGSSTGLMIIALSQKRSWDNGDVGAKLPLRDQITLSCC